MNMKMIAAMDEDNTIAIKGEGIPWDIEEDLQQYLNKTRDKPVIMGRVTFESTSQKISKPSLVLTRNESYSVDNEKMTVAHSKEEAQEFIKSLDEPVYNLGGSEIYKLFIDDADELIISHINGIYDAENPKDEKKFPEISLDEWEITDVEMYDEFQVIFYQRK